MLSYCIVFYYFVEFVAWSYTEIRFEGNHIRLRCFLAVAFIFYHHTFYYHFLGTCGWPLDKNLIAYIQIKCFYKEFRNAGLRVVVRSSSDVDFFLCRIRARVWRLLAQFLLKVITTPETTVIDCF